LGARYTLGVRYLSQNTVIKCNERPFEACVQGVKQEKLFIFSTLYFVLALIVILQIFFPCGAATQRGS
jgi:hypothetical protein